ncbi:MAG: peptidylprolyl isomerase [Defluviitaleaceae bacterium]|nr:peptidylprolyl isomerase [Defluviitaleaceae bacterium]
MTKKKKKNTEVVSTIPWYAVGGAAVVLIAIISAAVWFIYRDAEPRTGSGTPDDMQWATGDEITVPIDFPEPDPVLAEMIANNVTVATVNGTDINAGEVSFRLSEAEFATHASAAEGDARRREILEEAVRLSAVPVLVAEYAALHGIYLTEEDHADVEMQTQLLMEQFESEAQFDAMLLEYGVYSHEQFASLSRDFALFEMVIDAIVSDPDKFAEFEQYMDDVDALLEDLELLGAQHILLQPGNFETEEEAEALAHEIMERIRAGEDFNELRATYGQDPGQPPQGYTFAAGVMVDEFYEMTKSIEIGEISEVFRAPHGFHIVRRVEPNPDEAMLPGGPLPPIEQRMWGAVFAGFDAKASAAVIAFLPELDNIPVVF